MNIIFLDRATIDLNDISFSSVEECGTFISYPDSTPEETFERIKTADIVITNKVRMTKQVLERGRKIKLIAVIATGYNNVDLDITKQYRVAVCNVAGYAMNTVPQHTFSLILNLATKSYMYHNDVMSGEWQKAPLFTLLRYPTFELYGKTAGIIGFGVIGRAVAKIASGFGMKVNYYDPYVRDVKEYDPVDFRTILTESDIITLHCPLTKETFNLIDKYELSLMKPSVLLINTSRGGIVNEKALAEALNNQKIAGAGIDVLSEEPPVKGNVLLGAKNCIITPHSAWSTIEARQALVNETAKNIQAFIRGEKRNIVS